MAKSSEAKAPKALQTGVRKLRELMGMVRTVREEATERRIELTAALKIAVENNHLHKKAFAAVCAEDRMEPEKLADYYDHLEYYRDALGLNERAASAPKLEVIEGGKGEEPQTEAAE
jgi:hypothetical protein